MARCVLCKVRRSFRRVIILIIIISSCLTLTFVKWRSYDDPQFNVWINESLHSLTVKPTFIINGEMICETGDRHPSQIDLLLMIPTSANATAERTAIRNSYASVSKNNTANVRHVFLFGLNENESQIKMIRKESALHQDVVLIDMLDSYDNLTLKVVSGLKWSIMFCPNARYVIKVDTDTWLNTRTITDMITCDTLHLDSAIGGSLISRVRPIRDKDHKWYESKARYPYTRYPDYCSGVGYIIPMDVVRGIARVSHAIPLLRMEDVYIGACAKVLGIPVKQLPGFCNWRATGDPCKLNYYVTSHHISPGEMLTAWRYFQPNRKHAKWCVTLYGLKVPFFLWEYISD